MNHHDRTNCNSTGRPLHVKRFEVSLEQLQQLLENADWQPTLKPSRQAAQTLGEELGVPGFDGNDTVSRELGLSQLKPLAHLTLTGQSNDESGVELAGLVICQPSEDGAEAPA